jgi:phospholipid/cholesterol/gamma-HCH transport system substrate-binding protein
MKSTHNRRSVIVGLFLLISLLILASGVLMIGRLHNSFVSKFNIYCVFDQVGGLQKGNNIWLSGVKIGTIGSVRFTGKSQVEVTMKIENEARPYVRKDARAKISTDGLIGNKIVVISVGSDDAPCVTEGDTIAYEKALSTDDMMITLQENNNNLVSITADFKEISRKISAGEGTIGKLLIDDSLYTSVGMTVAELKKAAVNTERLTASLSEYGNKINREGSLTNDIATDTVVFESLRRAITELQQIAVTASAITTDLKKTTGKLGTSSSPAGVLLSDEAAAANLRETLKYLESSSRKLNEDLEALQHNFLLKGYFRKKAAEDK